MMSRKSPSSKRKKNLILQNTTNVMGMIITPCIDGNDQPQLLQSFRLGYALKKHLNVDH
jgi:hypothetical protein